MFLYIMNYLVGFDAWTVDELKGYGDAKLDGYTTISHAHPEIEVPGVEVTTGPLGQGIANAVGLAIASKNLAAKFNQPGCDVVTSRVYCMTGDGCLMEGVALEAISLAGHLHLDNLVLLYDNNQVTCDGPLDWINSEDINAKMGSCGWDVLNIADGSYDVRAIVTALDLSRNSVRKPTFINIRTVIGVDMASAGTAKAHHGVFDSESIAASKLLAGLSTDSKHEVPNDVLNFFRECRSRGSKIQAEWNDQVLKHLKKFPEIGAEFASRRDPDGSLGKYNALLANLDSGIFAGKATRQSNGIILEKLWKACPSICGGGADLVTSNNIFYSENDVFGPSSKYRGRYIRNGIREHAMASIANGMAAYSPGTFLPITATFFMFYIYVSLPTSIMI
jgi:dihydroxyacetone synthase